MKKIKTKSFSLFYFRQTSTVGNKGKKFKKTKQRIKK